MILRDDSRRRIVCGDVMKSILRWVTIVVVGVSVGMLATLAVRPGPSPVAPRSRPASGPSTRSATRPATAPATTRESYPGRRLVKASGAAAERLRRRLDDSFEVVVSPPFVVAGNLPRREVLALTRGTILAAAEAMWASYFRKKPDKVITVLLFKDDKTYRHWARRLFNDRSVSYFGYYKPRDRTMVMNINTGTGTLVHELTHALIVYDFPDVPTWFNEGLGTLHEQCRVGRTKITGLVNWRLPALRAAIGKGQLRPLRDLITRRDFSGRLRGLNYAQARYFTMYMQNRRLLGKFYRRFRDHHIGPDADAKAVEHVFGKKIEQVEQEFIAWVKTLRYQRR